MRSLTLDILDAALAKHSLQLDDSVKQVFLAGFLVQSGLLKTSVEAFDAACEMFLADTKLSHRAWLLCLGALTYDLVAPEGSGAGHAATQNLAFFKGYVDQEVRAYAELVAPKAPAPPTEAKAETPEQKLVLLNLPVAADDARAARTFLSNRLTLPNVELGTVLLSWMIPYGDGNQSFQVELVNCEGGPRLVGYRKYGARIIESCKPNYQLADPFLFKTGAPQVELRLFCPNPTEGVL